MSKKKYKPGDLFLVPLRSGGFGIGIIVRINKSVILGFFWKKKFDTHPENVNMPELEKSNVFWIKSMLGIFLLGPKQVFFRLFSPFFGYIVTAMLPQKRKNSRKNPLFLAPAENPQHALRRVSTFIFHQFAGFDFFMAGLHLPEINSRFHTACFDFVDSCC